MGFVSRWYRAMYESMCHGPWWRCTLCAARVMSKPHCPVYTTLHCTALYYTADGYHSCDLTNKKVREMVRVWTVPNRDMPPVTSHTGFHAALSSTQQLQAAYFHCGCCGTLLFLHFVSRIGLWLIPCITSNHEQRLLCYNSTGPFVVCTSQHGYWLLLL